MIKYYTIYGERCSGTNFLEYAIKENFKLEYVTHYGAKHFFGFHVFNNKELEDETLFIGIIRNPITWIDSFYKKPHHIPLNNKNNINAFLKNPFYSLYENTNNIIEEDKNMLYINQDKIPIYKNIFELRYIKNNYLINIVPKLVKNYILIRYEDLLNYYDTVLNFLYKKFDLIKIEHINQTFKRIEYYKGNRNYKYERKNINLKSKIINYIKKNVNKEQENNLGYNI